MINGELIVDNFAGGGGASTGIEIVTGKSVDIAINHDPMAIAQHKANHPRDNKMTQAISASCIAAAKRRYPVGSHMRIKTYKGGNGLSPRRLLTGVVREAEVVNADSNIFAIVEILPSRVRDSVMWRDIYVAMRDGKPYVG